MSKQYEEILFEIQDRVARIVLNRPHKLNAITPRMEEELKAVLNKCQDDDNVRVLILTGAGRGFCTGEDLQVIMEIFSRTAPSPDKSMPTPIVASPLARFLAERVEKPIIAAINGVCAAAGYGLALASDIRIASDNARFLHLYLKRALVASAETWFLPRLAGLGTAFYHILTSSEIDADEALRLNLVSKIVPASKLQDEAMKLAAQIAALSPTAVKFTKKAIHRAMVQDLNAVMEYVGYARELAMATGETVEASAAFLEKRSPKF